MQVLKNAGLILNTQLQTLYTCPTDTTSAIHTIFFNTISVEEISHINIHVYDASEGKTYIIASGIEVLPNATFTFDRPIYLDQGDQIKVVADRMEEIHAFASIMEIVPLSI